MTKNKWLVIGGCLLLAICGGLVGIALGVVGMGSLFFTVGPTFTTAEALAYDLVYETAGADSGTIEVLQLAPAGSFTAVLMGYEQMGQPQTRLVVARDDGREFFVLPMTSGQTATNLDLSAHSQFHQNNFDTLVAVYGQIYNPAIREVIVTFPAGYTLTANLASDNYLLFWQWSPIDGSPEPEKVSGYDPAGNLLAEILFP